MASLEQVLASIPGLAGYQAQVNQNNATTLGNLQQGQAVGGILAQIQKQAADRQAMQRDAQYRQQLAGATTDEERALIAMQAEGPKGVLSHLDRQSAQAVARDNRTATIDAARINAEAQRAQRTFEVEQKAKQGMAEIAAKAAEGRITQAERIEAEGRLKMDLARFMAANRPEPAQRPLQLTTDANGMQLIVNPDGTTRPLTTQDGQGVKKPVAADKPMTEFQGKAALYGTRSAQSDKVLRALEDKISTTGLVAGQSTGVLGTALMSADQQRVDQAQRDFVNAVLRQESGAVISPAEFENAKKQYFPQPGNDARTIAQKRANRQMAIQGFSRMSGPKGAADIQAIISEPLLPGVQGTNPTPQQASGKIGGVQGGWKVTPVTP